MNLSEINDQIEYHFTFLLVMQRTTPPFRADINGSFLRPQAIKDARQKFQAGEITAEQLKQVEDAEIKKLVEHEESIGLKTVSDGEYRRSWWHFDFFEGLTGIEGYETATGIQFQGVQTRHRNVRVIGKIDFPDNHPMLEHFKYLKSIVKTAVPKMTIPSPCVLHFRGGHGAINREVYPEIKDFFTDLGNTYRKAIKAFYDLGCRYLQMDDTAWACLCSEEQREMVKARGEDPLELQRIYADLLNYSIAEKPADMTISMHFCRGNYRSAFIASGGYEPVAEILFGTVNIDAFFLEYDTDRAGDFAPLRFLKPGKFAVLGLVTSKTGDLETKEAIQARIEEATKFVPKEQLCLSTQCGFASTEEGNVLTEEQQWNKLKFIIDVANDTWK